MCFLEKLRQIVYPSAYGDVFEIRAIEQFESAIQSGSKPQSINRFKHWLPFHKISQLFYIKTRLLYEKTIIYPS